MKSIHLYTSFSEVSVDRSIYGPLRWGKVGDNHLHIHLRLTNIRDGPTCEINCFAQSVIQQQRRVALQRLYELFVATLENPLIGMSGQWKEHGEARDFSSLALARCKFWTQR